MIEADSRWFLPVQNSCGCFWMVEDGSILFWMVLYGVGCFLPVVNGSSRYWADLEIVLSNFRLDLDTS